MPISLEEFKKLSEQKRTAVQAKYQDLIEFLKGQAVTTSEVAAFLGSPLGSAYGVLRRLEKQGIIERRFNEKGHSYWTLKTEEVGTPEA